MTLFAKTTTASRVARRVVMFSGAASLMARPARAEDHVFLAYTQSQLDRAYDQTAWAADSQAEQAAYARDSAAVRATLKPRTETYGTTAAENLDIFAPKFPGRAPILVFFHGGAWLKLTKDDVSTPAPTFVEEGGVYVAPNFGPVDKTGLPAMVAQCRRVIQWITVNAAMFGGDAGRIVIAGHSSGAHLAAVLLATDWAELGLPADVIKGAVLMSGIYDLYPAMLSSRRTYLKLSAAEVTALSPIRHLDRITCPVSVVWGDQDSPEFKRQSTVLADALQGMGVLRGRPVLFNTSHFRVPRQLDRSDTPIAHTALAFMGLA